MILMYPRDDGGGDEVETHCSRSGRWECKLGLGLPLSGADCDNRIFVGRSSRVAKQNVSVVGEIVAVRCCWRAISHACTGPDLGEQSVELRRSVRTNYRASGRSSAPEFGSTVLVDK